MRLKPLAALAVVAGAGMALATPAFAHVTTDPSSAQKGGEITLGFRVPDEEADATTTQFEVDLPTDHPLLGIDTEPTTGWTVKVREASLNPPVQTDDGVVNQAVDQIIWTADAGTGIGPGQFQEFRILVQSLPRDTDRVVFKALQTYSDGTIARWIDPVTAGQDPPEHPTPILTLTDPVNLSRLAGKSAVNNAQTLGIVGLVVGAVGLLAAVAALATRPRRRSTSRSAQ
jgi:periplasmic copper chaperone A